MNSALKHSYDFLGKNIRVGAKNYSITQEYIKYTMVQIKYMQIYANQIKQMAGLPETLTLKCI